MPDDEDIRIHPDVPTTGAIVKTSGDARALARRLAGEDPPNRCRFICVMCGWDQTYEFTPDEIEALGNDVSEWSKLNHCPGCDGETVVPYNTLLNENFTPGSQRAKEARREEFQEAAEVLTDHLKKEVVGAMAGGSIFKPSPEETGTEDLGTGPPRDDLPEAGDIDDTDLTPKAATE